MGPEFYCAAYEYLAGWTYKNKAPDIKRKQTNCCIAAEKILKRVFVNGRFTRQTNRDFMIVDGSRPWSPMDAVEAAGIGRKVDNPQPGCWHLVQIWGDAANLKRGHTCFYFEPPVGPIAGSYIIEATDAQVAWFRESTLPEKLDGRKCRLAVLDL